MRRGAFLFAERSWMARAPCMRGTFDGRPEGACVTWVREDLVTHLEVALTSGHVQQMTDRRAR